MRTELHIKDVPKVLSQDAECLHHQDPRVQRLASARWRLATGGTHEDWLQLHKTDSEAPVRDMQEVLRRAEATTSGESA